MTEIRKGYKQTEIGVIPEDWKVKNLGEVGSIKSSKRVYKNDYVSEGVPFYRSKEIIELSKNINPSIELFIERSRYNKFKDKYGVPTQGDLMITSVGTIGKVWISDGREFYYKDGNLTQFTSKDQIKIDFVKALFNSSFLEKQYLGQSYGSAQVALTINKLNNLKIPIPPLKEQEKIAEILSTTDKHIDDLDRVIEDYELLKKGMMQRLLTEGIGHTEFKDTEIGRIPKEWEVKRIGDLSEIVTGKTPPTKKSELYGTLYPWVTPSDINHRRNINSTERMLSESGFESTSVKLPENTLLVTCIASIGKNAILKRDGSCNQQINAILPNNEVFSTSYLYYWVNQNKDYLISFSGQTAVPILNKTTFKSVLLALPPLAEQKKIASILSSIDDHINQLKETKDNYTNLKQALMGRLLTGKIRVV